MKLETLHRRVFSLLPALSEETRQEEITRLLKRVFKNNPIVKFRCTRGRKSGEIVTWGQFETTDEDAPKITISLGTFEDQPHLSPKDVLFRIFETLAHEYVHLEQYKKAKGCPRQYKEIHPTRAYYGCKTELDAFGLSSALEQVCIGKNTVAEKYRQLFSITDPRYKRFLKKRWKHMQTLPGTFYINRDYATIQTTQQR